MTQDPITPDQQKFLDEWIRRNRPTLIQDQTLYTPSWAEGAITMYRYLLRKRKSWFRVQKLFSRIPRQLRLMKEDEDSIEGTIAQLIDEYPFHRDALPQLTAFMSTMLHAVYEGAEQSDAARRDAAKLLRAANTHIKHLEEANVALSKTKDMVLSSHERLQKQLDKAVQMLDLHNPNINHNTYLNDVIR